MRKVFPDGNVLGMLPTADDVVFPFNAGSIVQEPHPGRGKRDRFQEKRIL